MTKLEIDIQLDDHDRQVADKMILDGIKEVVDGLNAMTAAAVAATATLTENIFLHEFREPPCCSPGRDSLLNSPDLYEKPIFTSAVEASERIERLVGIQNKWQAEMERSNPAYPQVPEPEGKFNEA